MYEHVRCLISPAGNAPGFSGVLVSHPDPSQFVFLIYREGLPLVPESRVGSAQLIFGQAVLTHHGRIPQ